MKSTWVTNPALEARYADGWPALSRDTKISQQVGDKVRCSCCGDLFDWDFVETHHAYYLGEGDEAGLNIFPVCGNTSEPGTCHHWLHLKDQWYRDKIDPVWQSGNYPDVVKRLQHGFVGQPHILPMDWDWLVVGRVSAVFGGIAALTLTAFGFVPNNAKPTAQAAQVIRATGYNATNVRGTPGGEATGTLSNGTAVTVTDKDGDWCKVSGRGWVWCKFVVPK